MKFPTINRYLLLVSLCFLLAAPLQAEKVYIYVTNAAGTTVVGIDAATDKVVKEITGIEAPFTVTGSLDGRTLYIAAAGEYLYIVDQETGKHLNKVKLDGQPNHLMLAKDGKKLYIGLDNVGMDIMDTKTEQIIKYIKRPTTLHDFSMTKDGKYMICASNNGRFITLMDLATDKFLWEIHFDGTIHPTAVESNSDGSGRQIFFNERELNGFLTTPFDGHSGITHITNSDLNKPDSPVTRVVFPDDPPRNFVGRDDVPSHGMGIAPDGKTFWAVNSTSNAIFVYSLPDLKVLGHVSLPALYFPGKLPMSSVPQWVTFTPDSKKVYVSLGGRMAVLVIDVATMKPMSLVHVGERPNRIDTVVVK